jgi:putative transposase
MTRSAYPSDLTEAQRQLVAPLLPPAKSGPQGGRPRTVNLREVLNGIFYFLKGGGGWRYLPHDLPPWGTVHYYYRKWRREGVWPQVHDTLREQVRLVAQRERSPSAAVIDSQSVPTSKRGFPRLRQRQESKGASGMGSWTPSAGS